MSEYHHHRHHAGCRRVEDMDGVWWDCSATHRAEGGPVGAQSHVLAWTLGGAALGGLLGGLGMVALDRMPLLGERGRTSGVNAGDVALGVAVGALGGAVTVGVPAFLGHRGVDPWLVAAGDGVLSGAVNAPQGAGAAVVGFVGGAAVGGIVAWANQPKAAAVHRPQVVHRRAA